MHLGEFVGEVVGMESTERVDGEVGVARGWGLPLSDQTIGKRAEGRRAGPAIDIEAHPIRGPAFHGKVEVWEVVSG